MTGTAPSRMQPQPSSSPSRRASPKCCSRRSPSMPASCWQLAEPTRPEQRPVSYWSCSPRSVQSWRRTTGRTTLRSSSSPGTRSRAGAVPYSHHANTLAPGGNSLRHGRVRPGRRALRPDRLAARRGLCPPLLGEAIGRRRPSSRGQSTSRSSSRLLSGRRGKRVLAGR